MRFDQIVIKASKYWTDIWKVYRPNKKLKQSLVCQTKKNTVRVLDEKSSAIFLSLSFLINIKFFFFFYKKLFVVTDKVVTANYPQGHSGFVETERILQAKLMFLIIIIVIYSFKYIFIVFNLLISMSNITI